MRALEEANMRENDEVEMKRYPELPARDPLNYAKIDVPPDVARHIDAGNCRHNSGRGF